MTKYERINRAKLTDKGKAVYDKLSKATDGFKDKEAVKKNKAVLDKFYDRVKSGLPEAIKPVKSKKSKAKPKAKAKKPAYKNVNMGNFAKETSALAKKEGISYKEAQKKMSAIYKERKAKAQKKQGSDFDKMIAGLKKKVEYRGGKGLTNTTLKKDAKLDALDFGKRTSKGTGANQYGKAKKGRIYYEYRNNRADVKNAPPSQPYPKLESGGKISEAGDVDFSEKLLGYAKGGDLSEYGYFKSKAKEESKSGYVVHVNMLLDMDGDIFFRLSDFYDANETIATYEKGKTLLETNFDSKQDMLEWIDDNKDDFAKGGKTNSKYRVIISYNSNVPLYRVLDKSFSRKHNPMLSPEIEYFNSYESAFDFYQDTYLGIEDGRSVATYLQVFENGEYKTLDKYDGADYDDYAKGGYVKNQILSFSFNANNTSLDEIIEIVEKYSKNWRTSGGTMDDVGVHVTLRPSQVDDLESDLKSVDVFNLRRMESRYAKGGKVESYVVIKGKKTKSFDSKESAKSYINKNGGEYAEIIDGRLKVYKDQVILAKGGMTKEIENDFNMPKFLKDQIIDKDGKRKIDDKSIEMLTDYTNNVMPQTKDVYFKDGKYTKERQKLHKEIIDDFKGNLVCIQQDEPIAILMGGSPASGKSTFLRKYAPYLLDDEILRIDADEVRSQLPEYDGWNASATHLETKDIVNTLLSDRTIGLPCEYDIIYDGTMNNTKAYLPLIKLLRKLGYKIYVVYIDNVPKPVIEKRVKERYQKSGRFVPLEVVDDFFSKGKTALNEIKKKVDGYMVIDGSDSNYRIIEEGGMKLPKSRKYSQIGTAIDKMATGGEVFSEQIARGYDVNLKSGTGTYAKGGTIYDIGDEVKDRRFGNDLGVIKGYNEEYYFIKHQDGEDATGLMFWIGQEDEGDRGRYYDLNEIILSEDYDDYENDRFARYKVMVGEEEESDDLTKDDAEELADRLRRIGAKDVKVERMTYAKGGITIEGNPYKNEDFFIYRNGKEVVSWSADELMEDDYSQDTAQEMFDLYNNDKKELSYRLENLNYAKGGKTKKMKKDDNWIQGVDKEMERKGTKGAFTKQAKRAGMSTVAFAKEVLRSPDKYSEKTRERAQFMKNVNPELFEYGGKISEAGDVDFPEKLLGYAKGGKIRVKIVENLDEHVGYKEGTILEVEEIEEDGYMVTKEGYYLSEAEVNFADGDSISNYYKEINKRYAKGGKTDTYVAITLVPKKTAYKGGKGEVYKNMEAFYDTINSNEDKYPFVHYISVMDSRKSDPTDISEVRVYMVGEKSGFDKVEKKGLYDLFDLKKSSEKVKKYAKGGKLNNIDDVDDLLDEIMKDIKSDVKLKSSDLSKIKDSIDANLMKFYNKGGELFDADTDVEYAKGGVTKKEAVIALDKSVRKLEELRDLYPDTPRKIKRAIDNLSYAYYDFYQFKSLRYAQGGNVDSFSHEIARGFDVNLKSGTGTYAKGGKVQFRKLAKSKNFDIVTPDGRYEIEMGAFGMPKYIIVNGTRKDINTNPIAKKYRSEIQSYLDDNYAKGGDVRFVEKRRYVVEWIEDEGSNSEYFDSDELDIAKDFYNQIEMDKFYYEKPQMMLYDFKEQKVLMGDSNFAKGGKTQGYNARLDESLAMRDGSKLTKKVNYKGRRDESKGEEKALGKRAYSSVDTMDDAMLDFENFYAEGGKIGSADISRLRKNIMGTLSFDLKAGSMRKAQDFIVYPMSELEDKIKIQSDKKFGLISLEDGRGILSKGSGNTFMHLRRDMAMRNVITFQLSSSQLEELINSLRSTGGKEVGNSVVISDNSGASLLAEGGEIKGRYEVRVDGRPSYAVYDDLDEAYDEFIDTRSSYRYETDVMIIDTKHNETIEYYDAQEDREQSDEFAKGGKTQGYNSRLDESLAMRRGKAKTKKQSKKDRRDESKAMEKAKGKRAYSSVKTMDKKIKYRGKK